MEIIEAFVAGFVSTLVFHQATQSMLYAAGIWQKAPFSMTATAPFQIPAVLSLAFWGGLWGIVLWRALIDVTGVHYWTGALILGALGPSAIALFVVFPLKGLPVAGGWDAKVIISVLVLNGAWGFGAALIMSMLAGL